MPTRASHKARPKSGSARKKAARPAKRVVSARKPARKAPTKKAKARTARVARVAQEVLPKGPPPDSARVDFAGLSLRDALDLAILIEEEAEERYEKLSAMVGGRYAGDAGDVFRSMAKNENLHGSELKARREALFPGEPRTVGREMLDDVEAPDWSKAGVFISARQALEAALESEQKAHAFFAQAVPYLGEEEVRKLFRELAAEELKHQALLRGKLKGLPRGPDLEPEMADEPGSDPG